ncbi:hypothetical protein GPECTOR_846g86 [Gonium pectorale]|uniref:Ribosomal protein S21 n=1 Tax=Gonium pectorale TaxID=33097 RepID=A0A150FTX5_GONPE|nr:hypothetical protein GPECTOR_846g86 [Gonium pectorale]|eukprot:KXZ41072.1 hypothetical protein GPECTOR_846g86 [Gonium pectorale]
MNQLSRCLSCAGLAASLGTSALQRAAGAAWVSGWRGMAVIVEVEDNRVQKALADLNHKRIEAGIPDELRRRRYHMNGSAKRFEREKKAYKTAVGAVVKERIKWVMQRRRGGLLE